MQHSEGEDAARFSVLCFRRADKTANSIFYADKGVFVEFNSDVVHDYLCLCFA
ncbi:UNVERIFIED_ORG: hypothetical protein J2806_001696 [Kosakonia oryzae]|uniref:Uncharacterized protein n=1 Tax=Kosakonia radicincitans TaxID=283686 RepID=A0AAX2EQQ3_9ENTR|nr:hypothetical protein [Kosakonia oryzae]SFE17357.1 hypothetical protein SAMN03159468_01093 [Kosakonia radicincitans]SFR07999.1 hypothetical protein SAMN03159514_01743 [Kosakonia radicincitans]SFT70255.1 hypothetical protein SAMN03159428_01737 [Kosakonia radicincitans]SFX48275.1 hypothetical protein SAMN03159436_01734 [Kosakonia radicincitans]